MKTSSPSPLPGLDVDRVRLALRGAGGDPDRAGFGVLTLGQLDSEQAVREVRLDLLAVDVVREAEAPDELPVGPLHAVIALPVALLLELPFAAQRQHAVFALDLD